MKPWDQSTGTCSPRHAVLVKCRLARTELERTCIARLSLPGHLRRSDIPRAGPLRCPIPQAWPKDGLGQRQRKPCAHPGMPDASFPPALLAPRAQAHPGLSCRSEIPLRPPCWRLPPPLQDALNLIPPLTCRRSEAGPPPPALPRLRWNKGNRYQQTPCRTHPADSSARFSIRGPPPNSESQLHPGLASAPSSPSQ